MWQNVKIDLVCRFRCLGMQVLNFRYANMDFFETPHIQIGFLWKDPVFKYEFLVLFIYPWLCTKWIWAKIFSTCTLDAELKSRLNEANFNLYLTRVAWVLKSCIRRPTCHRLSSSPCSMAKLNLNLNLVHAFRSLKDFSIHLKDINDVQ